MPFLTYHLPQTTGLYTLSWQRLQKGNPYFKRVRGVLNKENSSDFFGFLLRHTAIFSQLIILTLSLSNDSCHSL